MVLKFAFLIVIFAMLFVVVGFNFGEQTNATKLRCEIVDDWIKPSSEMLRKQWDETIGVDCVGSGN